MKSAPFKYVRAESVAHALDVLAEHGGDAKAIAGGQSLVPMMAMRLARPAVLLDINRVPELSHCDVDGTLAATGATLRQAELDARADLKAKLPLAAAALRWVGHVQTRNRGTVGGSMVHADPSAELPLAALTLGATFVLQSRDAGERAVAAADFFLGPMFTATGETECLVRIDWPVWPGTTAVAFEETSIRHGDFAMASAACQLALDDDGLCRRAAIGLGGVDGTPLAFPELADGLVGRRIDAAAAADVAHAAAQRTQPGSDLHADADYRRHLGAVLLSRALLKAAAAATDRTPART